MQWLTLHGCLCCMAATDPRLILLRALDKGAGAPPQPVDHVVIAVPAGLMKPVLRALDILAPLASRLGPATINGNDVGKSNVARGTGWLIWRAGFRRVINRPEANRCTRRIGHSDLRARCEALTEQFIAVCWTVLGAVDVQLSRMTVVAIAMNALKLVSVLQQRVAIPMYSLSFPKKFLGSGPIELALRV